MVKYLQTIVDIVAAPPKSPVHTLLKCLKIRVMMLQWIPPHKIIGLTL
jgi:hypothetical protein